MSQTCMFCRIVARKTPADIEYEDAEVLAFRDLYPKAPVHILIIPKRHIESVATLTPADAELVGKCFLVARRLGEAKGVAERGHRGPATAPPPSPVAVRDVSLKIPDGQFVTVIGPSGAGKSSLLRCLNGLVAPTAGEILIDGEGLTAAGGGARRGVLGAFRGAL